MAIVEFTCLINRIKGRVGTDVFSFYRGTTFIKGYPTSVNYPNTYRQQQFKANLSSLSKLWYDLPNSTKTLWNSHASRRKGAATGYNHFISHNGNLLNASHSDLVYRPAPPPTPGTPAHARGFCVYNIYYKSIRLSWSKPSSSILYVTGRYKLHYGFCARHPSYGCCCADGYRPSLRFIDTVRSDSNEIIFPHDYPVSTRLYFNLKSIDKYGRKSPVTHNILDLSINNRYFYVCDYNNHRIMKFKKSDLSYVCKIGTQGSGNDQFDFPKGCACDNTYIYITDSNNGRVVKRLKSDLSYFYQDNGSPPAGDTYTTTFGISSGEKYFFVCDTDNHRIMKRLCSNMTGVCKIGSLGTGDGEFNLPHNLVIDHNYVYVTDTLNHRIVILNKSDLSFVSSFGAEGKGNYLFQNPQGIAIDFTHLYVSDTYNHRIVKYLKSDFSYVSEHGTQGSGNTQLDTPGSIALGYRHIYIADRINHRIMKLKKSDFSYINKVGSLGTGNTQFDNPRGICVDDIYNQIYNQ